MSKYEIQVDTSHTWEEGDINVISFVVEAEDAVEATGVAIKEVNEGKHNEAINGKETYIWDVSEYDKLNDVR